MSILIKGMEMPNNCYGCDFCVNSMDGEDLVTICTALQEEIIPLMFERQTDCPLIEVPPHGRLIDKEALESDISHSVVFTAKSGTDPEIRGANKIIQRINIAPTVIEADNKEGE